MTRPLTETSSKTPDSMSTSTTTPATGDPGSARSCLQALGRVAHTPIARALTLAAALSVSASLPGAAVGQSQPQPREGQSDASEGEIVPTLRSFTEAASIQATGLAEVEAAYRADFSGYEAFIGQLTLHNLDFLASYGITPEIEVRTGWHVFSITEDDSFGRIGGVGNPYIDGKFALQLSEASTPHALSLRGRAEFGVGKPPASDGVTLGGAALYSILLGAVWLDANAGLEFNTAQSPAYFSLPLSARARWEPVAWCEFYGELVEVLRVDELRQSATVLQVGAGFRPIETVSLDVTGGVGLSTTVPAGTFQIAATFMTGPPGR